MSKKPKKDRYKKDSYTKDEDISTREKRSRKKTNSADTRSAVKKEKNRAGLVKFFKGALIVSLVLVLAVVAYGAKLLKDTDNFLDEAYKPMKRETTINDNIDPIKDPIAILILGVDNDDERQLDATRTDAMLLATVSPETEKISLVSIPRDTYTQINTKEFVGKSKINAAYAYGEEEGSIDAVETLMGIPINYYMTIDFKAFEQIVDAFGGVEVEVPFDFVEQNAQSEMVVNLKEGRHLLDGEQALAFARTRKIDNDVMRGSRQQEIMQAVLKKAMNLGSISKLQEVLKALNGHFWTDMDMSTMTKVAESGLKSDYTFESYIFSWMSFDYYGESMVGLHDDSLEFISHRMKVSLGLELPDERDETDYEFESDGQVSYRTFPEDGLAVINP